MQLRRAFRLTTLSKTLFVLILLAQMMGATGMPLEGFTPRYIIAFIAGLVGTLFLVAILSAIIYAAYWLISKKRKISYWDFFTVLSIVSISLIFYQESVGL